MNKKRVKIIWNDAKLFSPENKDISISKMETTGFLKSECGDYIVVKNPITVNLKTKKKHPEKNPTFYLIPMGVIESEKPIIK